MLDEVSPTFKDIASGKYRHESSGFYMKHSHIGVVPESMIT